MIRAWAADCPTCAGTRRTPVPKISLVYVGGVSMEDLLGTSDLILFRHTAERDIEFVLAAEQGLENNLYVGQWLKGVNI